MAQAYRDQGVDWDEEEILRRSALVATELRRRHWRELKQQRKIERHEVPCGLLHTEDDWNNLSVLAAQDRLQREDWSREHKPLPEGCAPRLPRRTARRSPPAQRPQRAEG